MARNKWQMSDLFLVIVTFTCDSEAVDIYRTARRSREF